MCTHLVEHDSKIQKQIKINRYKYNGASVLASKNNKQPSFKVYYLSNQLVIYKIPSEVCFTLDRDRGDSIFSA